MLRMLSLQVLFLCFSVQVFGHPSSGSSSSMSSRRTSASVYGGPLPYLSPTEFDLLLQESVGEVSKVFQSRMQKFDDSFKELLKTSKRDFHTMFINTYGLLYERNSYIFTDMFQELERYYSEGGIELNQVLDAFFKKLYSKMFQVLNAQYTFDDDYLRCVSDKMEELKPFGDIPKKLKIEVRRSFIATRIFVQAMSGAADMLTLAGQIPTSHECSSALSVFSSCPSCMSGVGTTRLCSSVCPSSLSRCLIPHMELNQEWNKFVHSLLLLLMRLETSFNIESVVDPIDIKISEAIMNFQENGIQVSGKLFDQCGKPRIGKRSPRERNSSVGGRRASLPVDSLKYNRPQTHSASPGTSIERLLADVKRKVKKTKDLWHRMPNMMCSHQRFAHVPRPSDSQEKCWNGSQVVVEDKSLEASSSPVVHRPQSSLHRRSSLEQNSVLKQVNVKLKLITKKLNFAYNGLEWSDSSNDDGDLVSGNGSGSGGGDDDDDECPDDEEGCNSGNRPQVYSPSEPVDKDTDTNQGNNNVNSFISTSSSTANPLYPDVKSISTRAPVVVLVPEGKSSSASWIHDNLALLILTFLVVQSISFSALCCHFNG